MIIGLYECDSFCVEIVRPGSGGSDCFDCEVPDSTVKRWQEIIRAYQEVQEEMHLAYNEAETKSAHRRWTRSKGCPA